MAIATTDPRTGEVLKTFDELTDEQVEQRLARAAAAFDSYRKTSHEQRAGWLRSAADVLEKRTDEVAEMMTLEMGKTKKAAAAEVGKCVAVLRYYADTAADLLADEVVADPSSVNASKAYARYLPLGPVLAVMPWNFPLWQAMRFAAPALAAGNVGLLKHASNVPQTALFMEELFRDAGFPDDVFQTLLIGSGKVDKILRDPRVKAATLTGTEPAGVAVAKTAGEVLKKVVLELGGSDPFVVMPSADLAKAAKVATTSRCQNNGQSCISAKRFIVHTDVYDEFVELFAKQMAALVVGDPMEEGTDVGPLANEQGREDVEELVKDAVDKGATVLRRRRASRPGRLVVPADGARRHHQGDGHVPRGGLRAGRRGLPGGRHRRGDRGRQRDPLRARLQRLDQRRRRAGAVRPRPRGRPDLRQRHGRVVPVAAVRRREGLRPRPRARRARHPGVHQRQDRLGRLTRAHRSRPCPRSSPGAGARVSPG